MVSKGTSAAMLFITYVIAAISTINVTTIPNQIGSYPKEMTAGRRIGTVSIIIARPSMKQPPIR